ncbi:condensin complex subunit 2/barren [Pyronema domesticum]|uniref:Condensin complex subunit 2 n=1 Tax=Pyronema omphalodes (strain CBS 100304) TaxID=1076935 RepID=U4L9W4_PYROM|nr:condensin complex subunit 2/barren [Pyronema domesticum]CCX06974.1 Similar to Condensin complex subunit 2; acc. no. Q9Y7R3 [Pyronema omphalodes CBS 100304]
MARSRSENRRQSGVSTPIRTTMIPLNDDSAEKAKRQKERTLLQSIQRQKMLAAASPSARADVGSPITPRSVGQRGETIDAVTPLKKVPLLANWEQWLKAVSDNKITPTNSWDVALIDYFHDMSLLKEGNSINFQKASCTLDGCVKIYTTRIDSVASETSKLLSGLAESDTRKKGRGNEEDGEGSDDEDGDEDGEGKRKPKRKTQRSSEATLAKDFSQLQIKKLELEFSVDPLFRKASADFDEGGAKGLLLNHLSIDNNGRIVFDSSDDKDDEHHESNGEENEDEEVEKSPAVQLEDIPEEPEEIANKLGNLRSRFFPDLSILDNQDICPSLKNVDFSTAGTLDIPFLKPQDDKDDPLASGGAGGFDDDDRAGGNDMAFGFDDGYGVGGDDDGDMTMAFGEGGEVWANQTMADGDPLLNPSNKVFSGKEGDFDPERSMVSGIFSGHDDILSYFDEAMQKNWAGPEHWRIRKIKDSSKQVTAPRVRKEKEAFEINFMDPGSDASEEILAPPKTASTINLSKAQRKSNTRNLLPDDKHFNSKQLIRLFLKPKKVIMRGRRPTNGKVEAEAVEMDVPENMDEEFWAKENLAGEIQASSTPGPKGDYDANFFNDDNLDLPVGLGDDDDEDAFADARESFSPGAEDRNNNPSSTMPMSSQFPNTQMMGFGSQLVTQSRRVKPSYMQYARVAKKVDVRKLKENLWSSLSFESQPVAADGDTSIVSAQLQQPIKAPEEPRKFTEVINDLRNVYPEKTIADISTSYCFICVLHLANEKGLVVEEEGGNLQELVIRKDLSAHEPDAF